MISVMMKFTMKFINKIKTMDILTAENCEEFRIDFNSKMNKIFRIVDCVKESGIELSLHYGKSIAEVEELCFCLDRDSDPFEYNFI